MSSLPQRKKSFSVYLGIEEKEKSGVFLLFIHYFFQGLGMALFFTAASTLFLTRFGPEELAIAFIFGGLAVIITSRVYAQLEHNVKLETFIPYVVLFLAVSSLAVWFGFFVSNAPWFFFFVFTFFRVHYCLSNLEFWGLTSLLFNVRQGKRLFGIIGAGDIPAKIIGYLSVFILIPIVGTENLFLLSALFFGCSFVVVRLLMKQQQSIRHLHHEPDHSNTHTHSGSPEKFMVKLFGNKFILYIALFSFLAGMAMVFIDFAFFGEVKLKFKKSHDLSVFLSLYMGSVMSLTFLLKLFLSGRIIQRIGMKNCLLFAVISLLPPVLLFTFLPVATLGLKVLLFFFAALYGVRDIFRFTLFEPAFLSMFQPLTPQLRLKGHTVIKGAVDGLAVFLGGLFLWSLTENSPENLLKYLLFAMAFLLLLSIPFLLVANRQWILMLRSSVRKRFLDGSSLPAPDENMVAILRKNLSSHSPGEVIYSLKLLEDYDLETIHNELIECTSNSHEEVSLYALDRLMARKGIIPQEQMEILMNSKSGSVREKAIGIGAGLKEEWQQYANWEKMRSEGELLSALNGLLGNSSLSALNFAKDKLRVLLESKDMNSIHNALKIVGDWKLKEFSSELGAMLRLADVNIVNSVLDAGGKLGMEGPILSLLQRAIFGPEKIAARNSLSEIGDDIIPFIPQDDLEMARFACELFRKSSGIDSENYLIENANSPDQGIRTAAITSLVERRYESDQITRGFLHSHLEESHERLKMILNWIHSLESDRRSALVIHALNIELGEEIIEAINLLTIISSPQEMQKARQGLNASSLELRADGIEILEHFLPKKTRKLFLGVIENIYLDHRLPIPEKFIPTKPEQVLHDIISSWDQNLNSWTLAVTFDCVFKYYPHFVLLTNDVPKIKIPPVALKVLQDLYIEKKDRIMSIIPSNEIMSQLTTFMESHKENTGSLTLIEKVTFLKRINLFSGTPENILAEVAAIAREEKVEEDIYLLRKGEAGSCMYIIVDGEIKIEQDGQTLAKLGKNDFFGELALIETEFRSADALSSTDSLLLRIDQEDFYELIEDRVEVMRAILMTLAGRIRTQNELINSMRKKEIH